MLLFLSGHSVLASNNSPEEVYEGRSNNLQSLPESAISTKQITLVVSFNLEYDPNSIEAEQFLRTWYEAISALPDDVDLEVFRQVAPSQFQYAVSLTFNNWEEYRAYESRPEFLQYYYEHWKPHVIEAEERVYLGETLNN
ncbi:MAG: hypothetical protein RIC29_17085 [Rhodospirillaceae bacterium]